MNKIHKFLAASAITLFGASTAFSQTVVAGWTGGSGFNASGDPADFEASTLVDSVLGAKGVSSHAWSSASSNDGTWGTASSTAAPDNGFSWQIKTGEFQEFTITNVSGADLALDSIHFDYAHVFGALTINLSYASGDLAETDGTLLGSFATTGSIGNGANDWEDADVSIAASLTDTVLANSEFATFRVDFVGGTAGFDNLAVSVVPEPSSYALLVGCFVMGALGLRRRR